MKEIRESMMQKSDIEKLKSEIKVLQAKVEFLEELDRVKTPAQEAYKEYCGEYPPTNPSVDNIDDLSWEYFQAGWNAAQPKDVEVNETPKPRTLYDALNLSLYIPLSAHQWINHKKICDAVRGWLIDHTVIETEDEEMVTFTILKEQLQTPKEIK